MKIDQLWKRIGGVHVEDDGTVGAVWLAHDTTTSVVHLYDAAVFRNEVPVVIEDAITCRGRYTPVAWSKKNKAFADALLNGGVTMLPDACVDDQAMQQLLSQKIWQMLRSSRFRVDRRVGEWLREYKDFFKDGSKVPEDGFPLMAATRHAVEMLDYARAEGGSFSRKEKNYPDLAIV